MDERIENQTPNNQEVVTAVEQVSEDIQSVNQNVESQIKETAGIENTFEETIPQSDISDSGDTVVADTPEKVFCVKCGAELAEDQAFCPKCGHKVGEKIAQAENTAATVSEMPKSSSKKKIGIIIGVVAAAAVIALLAVFLIRGKQATDITLNKESVTIKVGDTADLTYVINPEDTKDKTVTWKSSNESIATVSGGKITAKNEGDCIITVSTNNGKTDTCNILVEAAGPDFDAIYNEYCSSTYATVASDGSYLFIDTNPSDKDDYTDYEAYIAILAINEALGLPESVTNRMGQTRSMDGIQTATGDDFEVNWTYHPNKGMEVTYSLTK